MSHTFPIQAVAVLLLAGASQAALSATLYSNDFETQSNGFSGAGSRVATQGYSAYGFGNQFLFNDSVPPLPSVLGFNLGSAATAVQLNLSLAIIDSWDNGQIGYGPDAFVVTLDGNTIFNAVFDNYLGGGATTAAGLTSLVYNAGLGFNSGFNDAAYTLGLSLGSLAAGPHTLTFAAAGPGWQGGNDESWAIDNVLITGTLAVPEPSAAALMLAGLLVAGAVGASRSRG